MLFILKRYRVVNNKTAIFFSPKNIHYGFNKKKCVCYMTLMTC